MPLVACKNDTGMSRACNCYVFLPAPTGAPAAPGQGCEGVLRGSHSWGRNPLARHCQNPRCRHHHQVLSPCTCKNGLGWASLSRQLYLLKWIPVQLSQNMPPQKFLAILSLSWPACPQHLEWWNLLAACLQIPYLWPPHIYFFFNFIFFSFWRLPLLENSA